MACPSNGGPASEIYSHFVRSAAILCCAGALTLVGGHAATSAARAPALEVTDLPFVLRAQPTAMAGLRFRSWFPNEALRDVVDTGFHDPRSRRVLATRVERLRGLGVRRAALARFETDDVIVELEGLLLPDAGRAARALDVLEQVHRDTFDVRGAFRPRKLGSGAWGYNSRVDADTVAAIGFRVGNLALRAWVASIGSYFTVEAHALALEVAERARIRARK